ncbi:neuraminidase-like domain-containing protein [Halomonas cerina]|uniref:Peptidoglycan hydrolase-like protein with peptidoglycan-binding domain/flagellar biosynthesis chaperone FliJ n=1 Tax=Halomonas cerina TaxID=447424 RepID=A0A839V5Q0_9GAMM|nr:neuraminidase-like domain-containing protein [Halomonas cerina]MBB3189318.1 peptidoglycan hydrolase-like protein with peptidoglycan-binding domain/flagellar biosynthesis chaperone FliJ [Halomonas cerina]
MNEVTFPLRIRMRRDTVADLHAVLIKLGHNIKQTERVAQHFGASTRDAVREFQKTHGLQTLGEVDEATAKKLNELIGATPTDEPKIYRVSGRVLRADGAPVKDAQLKFFHQGIIKTMPLDRQSSAKTDANGNFAFEYPQPKDPIDLGIELVVDAHRGIEKTRPRIIGNAGPDERVTFVVGDEVFRGASTFERIEKTVETALASEGVKTPEIVGFDQETLARLSLRSGITPRELVLLRQAYAVAKDTGLDAAIIHGIGKHHISIGSTAALLVQDPAKRRAAVKAALAANDIPARREKDAAKALDKLDELSVAEALTNPAAPDITSVGTVLEAARISKAKRAKLADRYIKHTGTPEEFWKAVRTGGDLTNAEIKRVQFEVQLAVATQNHALLNAALKSKGVAKVEDLATFDKQGLLDLIKGTGGNAGAELPADLKAAGTTEEEYAELIFRVIEDALPTEMVAHRVANFPDGDRIGAFLASNPSYNLRATSVHTYLAANPNALSFTANPAEAKAVATVMKKLERAYRIAPPGERIATMEKLLADGLDSATKVRALGRAAFMRTYEQKLGSRAAAERVFRRANNASALATVVATRYAPAFNATPMYALPNASLPAFADFFGSPDFCSCGHCQSVYSPAAYLVDTLNWLDGRPSTAPNKSALNILFDDRRADIGGIELSCTNTNTPLPYIDLVNETLELQIAPPQGTVNYQTTGTAADLRAHPEHLRREAYQLLAGAEANTAGREAVYPFNLPFDLWLEEARVYLGHLGMPRYRVMEALQGAEAARGGEGVAIETLGMSPREWDVIAGQSQPAPTPAEFWGLVGDANFATTLSNVSRFLAQAAPSFTEHGMAFSELADLLRTDFVQKQGPLKVTFNKSTCDTEDATLGGVTQTHLGVMHRFIRLQRRLGWSALDQDRAISVLGGGTLDEACLKKVVQAVRLATDLKRPVSELLTWWGPLDTRRWRIRLTEQLKDGGFELTFDNQLTPHPERNEDGSPYDWRFLDPSLEVNPASTFEINSNGDELKAPIAQGLAGQLTPIAAALGATAEELTELLPLLGAQPADLNLANLSALSRHVSLARALNLTARELVAALALTGIDPFDATKPEGALAFVDGVHFIRESGFSIDELNYLLRHVDTKPATLEPDDTDIGLLLFELGSALRAAEAGIPLPEAAPIPVPSGEPAFVGSDDEIRQALADALGVVLEAEVADEALDIIDVDLQPTPAVPNPTPEAGAAQFIDANLSLVLVAADAKAKLAGVDPALLRVRRQRLEYTLVAVVDHLRQAAKAAAVIERLSSAVGIEQSVCAPLLRDHLSDPGGSGASLLEVFSDVAVLEYDETEDDTDEPILPAPADLQGQFAAYKLIHKTALILGRLRINKTELDWVLDQGPAQALPSLNLNTLPVDVISPSASYGDWVRLRRAVTLRDQFSPRQLFDLFQEAAEAESDGTPAAIAAAHRRLLDELERRSRWARGDLEALVGAAPDGGVLGFVYPGDWKGIAPLIRVAEVMDVVRRVGLSAETIWDWREIALPADGTSGALQTAVEEHERQATEIKQAVRAHHNDQQWYEIAPTLRDPLRERQRDALVAWLIGNDDRFADTAALFDHLLLDVEMSACQLTSRIKQAISSTQLFVQHLLLGLEVDRSTPPVPLVEFSEDDADEWSWRKNYRVWEANRKVFLYPENYLEPELRDNKTPFFVELENELLQNEVTAESAETAVRHYLEKLDEVARLEIVGLCEQKGEGPDVLHVFGRTRGTPPNYYYRTRVDKHRWTPWEKVEAGIEGDHLVPVVFNRRLYLFWAMISEAALEEESEIPALDGPPQTKGAPQRYYQIRLAWSQHTDDGWAAKKIATSYIGQDLTGFLFNFGLSADIRKDPESTQHEFFLTSRAVKTPAGSPAGEDLIIQPIRYRPGKREQRLSMARKRGDGSRIQDDCGFIEFPPGSGGGVEFPPGGGGVLDPGDTDDSGYYWLPRFRMSGCDGTVSLESSDGKASIAKPSETIVRNQTFARFAPLSSSGSLDFPAAHGTTSGFAPELALTSAKVPFEVVPLRMDDFRSSHPFFYQDQRRTFFIEPRSFFPWIPQPPSWVVADKMALEPAKMLGGRGDRPLPPELDPWEFDAEAAVNAPAAVIARRERGSPTGHGLAARAGDALAASLGSRVAFISNIATGGRPTRTALGMGASIVNGNGVVIGDICPGAPAVAARGLPRTMINATYVMPDVAVANVVSAPMLTFFQGTIYRFDAFYHPYVCMMRRELNRFGLGGLFEASPNGPAPGLVRQEQEDPFFNNYGPTDAVRQPRPLDNFDFSAGGAYSIYNWEVFFHVPFRIACQLNQNQRFAEAQKWFHYIFDPTESVGAAPQRFWRVKPLAALFNGENDESGPIAELLLLLQYDGSDPDKLRMRDELVEEVATMRANPFSPHAQARLRHAVYARAVVLKYIDNLIEWGDQLFRRDTMESINEATQLYILAGQLLGRRPRRVEREERKPRILDQNGQPVSMTFDTLRTAGIDEFGNALLEDIEGMLPETTETEGDVYEDDVALLGTLFFCVPPNEKLLADYWGRGADRLFKIRHCMNIEGVVRQLPLFEPPIDPALLVRAKAAGVDLASVLSDVSAPLPCYRYQVLSQKATELCADVRGLGQALLSALEKKDAEELALLRAGHQVKLEDALLDVRKKQVDEAREALEALRRSKESAEIRRDYYRSRPYMNAAEAIQFTLSSAAAVLDTAAVVASALGTSIGATPDITSGAAGFGGSPVATLTVGGIQGYRSTDSLVSQLQTAAGLSDRGAQIAGLIGGYERRDDDWQHQGVLADKDVEALERQIVGAEVGVAIAEKELSNLELQLEQSKETAAFLRDKYTNVQLYQWMVGQLSSLHFQAYQLAYDLAKRAERAWQFELATPDKTFIQFGYWDSLKKGLLAGDRLHHDLKRMDVAYLNENKREREIVQHVSIRDLDPEALLHLKRDGVCHIEIPEDQFDLVTPGHYMRRIKTVALSLPSVTGPYSSVPCTVTLESGSIRTSPDPNNPTFRDDLVDIQSIVTSQAQEDSGLFETSLRDDRYLPFEGAGAIDSKWRLELPKKFRQFDYDTISDAILHIRYTARDGGVPLREAAEQRVAASVSNTPRLHLVSARTDFPDAWAKFLAPPDTQNDQTLSLAIEKRLFLFPWQGSQIKIAGFELFLVIDNIAGYAGGSDVKLDVGAPDNTSKTTTLSSDAGEFGGLPHDGAPFGGTKNLGDWTVTFKEAANIGAAASVVSVTNGHHRLNPNDVRDLLIVFRYTVS